MNGILVCYDSGGGKWYWLGRGGSGRKVECSGGDKWWYWL